MIRATNIVSAVLIVFRVFSKNRSIFLSNSFSAMMMFVPAPKNTWAIFAELSLI